MLIGRLSRVWRLGAVVVVFAAAVAAVPAYAQRTPGLDETRAKVEALTSDINDAEVALSEVETALQQAEATNTVLRDEAEGLRERVVEAAIIDFTRPDAPPNIFGADDLIEALRADVLSDVVVGADLDAVEQYRSLFEDLSVSEQALNDAHAAHDAELERLSSSREELAVELARLEEVERERLAELARKRAEEAARKKAEEAARAAEAAKNAGSGSGSSGSSDSTDSSSGGGGTVATPSSSGGQLVYCPVQGAVSFIDSWGAARSGGRRHKGVDMMAAIGTPIVAPVSGTVTHRSNRVGGRSFHLNGNDGNYYYGTHLSGYGESGSVDAGTVIGYVGDDGNARGIPHLHFEIHPGGGSAINPYPAVRAAC